MTVDLSARKRGRPRNPARAHKRTIAFSSELYEALEWIAGNEERTVTAQINKILREFAERYESEHGPPPVHEGGHGRR
jgi:hypothetical protein